MFLLKYLEKFFRLNKYCHKSIGCNRTKKQQCNAVIYHLFENHKMFVTFYFQKRKCQPKLTMAIDVINK